MKSSLYRWMGLAVVAGILAAAPGVWAGECCTKASENVKAGKACEKCLTEQCCKDSAKKVAEKGEAKACTKCAAKKEEKKS